ncbi:MAG: flagellar export protein FliJ [Burkholderiaceae bacterium]|nr:flagellar export protein FliJ [Sulfuritalea sp.]MCF8174118.1 flagellar export protein FliJ [Burkholderiaceae bacterium]MCF8184416.1 flagellar export protein FliJ [Polynucleobacter sp.]
MRLDEAARKLGELIAGEQEASQRHRLLVEYREEYYSRFLEAAKSGIGPGEWNNYINFLARIDAAIAPAAQSMTLSQEQTLAGQQDWMGKQGRVKAFDTLANRHRSKLAGKEQRAEQQASDEHGARTCGSSTPD